LIRKNVGAGVHHCGNGNPETAASRSDERLSGWATTYLHRSLRATSDRRRAGEGAYGESQQQSIGLRETGSTASCIDLLVRRHGAARCASGTLARLRRDLAELGLRRSPDVAEPEDHAAILCELMSGLARRQWPAPPEAERALFEAHLAPWIGRFFADLEEAKAARFYRCVGALGRVYVAVEAEAFALPA
jgi:hypothetical protein